MGKGLEFTNTELNVLAGILDFVVSMSTFIDGETVKQIRGLHEKINTELSMREGKVEDELIETIHREGPNG